MTLTAKIAKFSTRKSNMFVHFDHTHEYNSSVAWLALGSKLAACNVELAFY